MAPKILAKFFTETALEIDRFVLRSTVSADAASEEEPSPHLQVRLSIDIEANSPPLTHMMKNGGSAEEQLHSIDSQVSSRFTVAYETSFGRFPSNLSVAERLAQYFRYEPSVSHPFQRSPEVSALLRELFAELYPREVSARRVVSNLGGLSASSINFSGSAIDIWFSVLSEAEKHGEIDRLVAIARREFPTRREWRLLGIE